MNRMDIGSPLITIIVAVRNRKDTLQRCIDSIKCQSYKNWELIIIDGGSNDGSVDIIRANEKVISYWQSSRDNGVYRAFNIGLQHSNGEWIYFLGADDYLWNANSIEQMSEYLNAADRTVRIVYGKVAVINDNCAVLQIVGEPWNLIQKRFLEVMAIPHQGVFHRKSTFETHGRFDESYRIAGDYELLLRELKSQGALFAPDVVVAAMQVGGISSDPQKSMGLLWEMYRARRSQGLCIPGLYWMYSTGKVCARRLLYKIIGQENSNKILDLGRRMLGMPPYWTRK